MSARTPPILNVDDSEAGRYAKTRTLANAGFQVIEASTGTDALRLVGEIQPPLVLLDVMLPDINGLEVCRLIKRDFPSVLVLQISATYVEAADKTRGLEAGADSYLAEPVEPAELVANVQALLRLKRAEDELKELNETLEGRVTERTEELRRVNDQLLQSQKLEALGQLTGGIAHDFNNLLMAILGNLKLLRKRSLGDDDSLHLIDSAIEGALRGQSLTQRLLVFARRKEMEVKPVDVAAVIAGMSDMLRRSIEPTIRIDLDVAPDLWPALVDAEQLELVLLNLSLNGRDAMPDGGVLTVCARNVSSAKPEERLPSGDYICITVADTGTGMDEATLAKAIDPFFTTKGVGKGTGLGLSTAQGLASQSGGALRLSSRLGAGTSAELWLLRSKMAPIPKTPPVPGTGPAAAEPQPRTVLLVEDDPLILMTTADMVRDLGHEVTEALSGAQALEILRSGRKIDVVISDQGMPEMTGLQLVERIRASWPDLPIVLATGYANLPDSGDLNVSRLAKPYEQEEISAVIARLVNPGDGRLGEGT